MAVDRAPNRKSPTRLLHHHASALSLLTVFDGVLLIGTVWRLVAIHAVKSSHPVAKKLGRAMAFQY